MSGNCLLTSDIKPDDARPVYHLEESGNCQVIVLGLLTSELYVNIKPHDARPVYHLEVSGNCLLTSDNKPDDAIGPYIT